MSQPYAKRCARELGAHYTKHVEAMSIWGLNSKSDIAAELAVRDMEIEQLRKKLHDVETICDPAGIIAENALVRDQNQQLQKENDTLRVRLVSALALLEKHAIGREEHSNYRIIMHCRECGYRSPAYNEPPRHASTCRLAAVLRDHSGGANKKVEEE